ncbi:MAG: hypothetical protein Q9200_006972 [Gallowayella weberi]
MSSSIRSDVSPGPQIRETPGAFPSTPAESDSPPVVSSQLSLSQAVHERRAEYTVPQKIRIKVGTWNVAALSGTEKDIGSWFVDGKGISESLSTLSFDHADKEAHTEDVEDVGHQEARRSKKKPTVPLNDPALTPGGNDIGLYVLGLQEIIDVSSATEALRPYNDPWPGRRWKQAVEDSLPRGYVKVAEQQLVGLFLFIYAAPKIAPTISSVSTTSVGTGLMGYMGNKGAVTTRIVLGETTRLVFINCHLAAGVEDGSLGRRNWDAAQVLKRTKFEPIYNGAGEREESGQSIGDEDFAFWFGDLNYRLEGMPGEDVRRLLMLHTKNEYRQGEKSRRKIDMELAVHDGASDHHSIDTDSTSHSSNHTSILSRYTHTRSSTDTAPTSIASEALDPTSDPGSLQTTLTSLLPHDQLHQQMRQRKAFHDGWREGPINFLPTYKYDVGSVGMYDSSEKKRGPSWCDRILFRTRRDRLAYEENVRAEEAAKKRDQELRSHGVDDPAVNEEDVLFEYDPATDGDENDYNEDVDAEKPDQVTTIAGFEDKIHIEYYTSHQRVLSSDHKPLDAVFTLHYEAVDPDLKAKVHQDVARELDKAENERRPAVTIVVDHHHDHGDASQQSPSEEGVEFGDVHFDSPATRTVTIANTGRVSATVGFTDRIVSADQADGTAPPWLHIHFDRATNKEITPYESHDVYTLEPGDTANVELTIHVKDMALVRLLNERSATLEDVLVLRIHNGRDHFLPIHATWLPSSFGRSVGSVVKVPEGGIRKSSEGAENERSGWVKWSAPREIFRLTEAVEDLVERVVAEWGMKSGDEKPPWEENCGWPFITKAGFGGEGKDKERLKEQVRYALDNSKPISMAFMVETEAVLRVEAVAESLLTFMTSLEDGVIPEALWADLEKHTIEREEAQKALSNDEEERMQILDILTTSPAHSTSFTFITSMLVKLIQEIISASIDEAANPSQPNLKKELEEAYTSIFSDIIIKAAVPSNSKERRASLGRRRRIIEIFLVGGL